MVLFVLNLLHVEVRLAEVLRGLELLRLLDVEVVQHAVVRSREVTGSLTRQPTGCHIRYLGGRHQVVHLLRDGSRYLVVVDGDGPGSLLRLAEHIILRPFQCFLVAGSTHEDVTAGRDNFLHAHLAVVRFQLRQFLKAQGHRHLVGAGRTNQAVYLMEVECRQLIYNDAHRNVSLGIDSGNQSVQHQCIQ